MTQVGVGELVKIGIERGRKTRPKLGGVRYCGEHGGEPDFGEVLHRLEWIMCPALRSAC